jgi:tryptophan-rich sensory protein
VANLPARRPGWRVLAVSYAVSFSVAGVGRALTELGPWYLALRQPPWKPPDYAFGIIWTLIFVLIAASAALAWSAAITVGQKKRILALFGINAVVNVAWSALYFGLHRPDWSMAEWFFLWLSVLSLPLGLWRISRWAALLNLPYLTWVSAAGVLNWTTIALNGPFG